MQEQDGLNPAERELESALKSVTPAAIGVDCVAAGFAAGARSMRREVRVWRSAAVLILALGAGSWLIPIGRERVAQPLERGSASVARATHPQRSEPLSPQSVLALGAAVRKNGLDALPAAYLPAAETIRARDFNLTSPGDS
jgi:hypothetical protein